MDNRRYEMIRDILDVYDTIDNLRTDNRILRERLASYEGTEPIPEQSIGYIELELIKMSREQVLKNGMGYWHSVRVEVNDDGEIEGVQSYESWLSDSLRSANLPSWLSLDGYKSYFEEDLRERYEQEKENALAAIHNEGC